MTEDLEAIFSSLAAITLSDLLGVAVSLLLFVLGYRRTIGARRERTRSANDDIGKTLLRRLVLESHLPTVEQMGAIVETKSRDFRVPRSHLLSPEQIEANLYTRLVELDFITLDQRKHLVGLLFDRSDDREETPADAAPFEEDEKPTRAAAVKSRLRTMMFIAASSSLVGSVFAAIFSVSDMPDASSDAILDSLLPTLAMSLAVMVFVITLYLFRERQQEEEPSFRPSRRRETDLEREFLVVARRLGLEPELAGGPGGRPYDWSLAVRGEKILVELKNWGQGIPTPLVTRLARKLATCVEREGASRAVIVTGDRIPRASAATQDKRVDVMSLRQFRSFLVHGSM